MAIINELNPWMGAGGVLNSGANALAETLLRVPQIKAQLEQAGLQNQNSQLQNQLLTGQVQQQPQQFAQQQQYDASRLTGMNLQNAGQAQQNDQMKPAFDLMQKLNTAKLTGEEQQNQANVVKNQAAQQALMTQKGIGDAVSRVLVARLSGQQPDPKDVAALTAGMVQQGSPAAEAGVMQSLGMGKQNNSIPGDLVRLYGSTANANPGMDPSKIAGMIPNIWQTIQGLQQGGATGPTNQQSQQQGGGTNYIWTPQGLVPKPN